MTFFRSLPPRLIVLLTIVSLTGCHAHQEQLPGDRSDARPWQGISENETIHFTGTEPFWSGDVSGATLTYRTPGNSAGEHMAVSRFAGRGGVSFSGTFAQGPLTLALSPAACSDGMSDRRYPFLATLGIGGQTRQGCAWTDRRPYKAAAAP